MRLNMDCVRDILLVCEAAQLDSVLDFNEISALTDNNWDATEIQYCCMRMYEGNLINVICRNDNHLYAPVIFAVLSLTWQGHQFLESIRDKKRWEKVKGILGGIRNYSLSAISSTAEGITSAAINAYFSGLK